MSSISQERPWGREGLLTTVSKPWQQFDPDLREWVEAKGM